MPAKRTKLIASVFIGILICVIGWIGFIEIAQKGSEGQAPIRRLQIMIEVGGREELFAQLRSFANKHNFEIFIRKVDVTPEGLFIEMYRDDLKIFATDDPGDPTKIDFRFYERDLAHPSPEVTVDELFSDLKRIISAVPGAEINEER